VYVCMCVCICACKLASMYVVQLVEVVCDILNTPLHTP